MASGRQDPSLKHIVYVVLSQEHQIFKDLELEIRH